MKLAVVIVNYRTPALAADCLRSLAPELAALPGSRAIVVDNASGDDSVPVLTAVIQQEGFAEWATLLPSPENGGFSCGNNLGIRAALAWPEPPEYVHFLNPDTRVRPGALRELVAFLDAHPEAGIAGSRLEHADGEVQRSAFRFPGIAAELESSLCLGVVSRLLQRWVVAPPAQSQAHVIDWVCGASMMVRRTALERAGWFDERYFLYYEETDLCRQARAAGFTCWYVPASRVVHLGGQSTGLNEQSRPLPPSWFESRRYYFRKNHGRAYLLAANVAWLLGFFARRTRSLLQSKRAPERPRLLADFMRRSFVAPRSAR